MKTTYKRSIRFDEQTNQMLLELHAKMITNTGKSTYSDIVERAIISYYVTVEIDEKLYKEQRRKENIKAREAYEVRT